MRGANAGRKREPGKRLELVVEKDGCQAAAWVLAVDERACAAVIENRAEQFIVLLIESVKARLKTVSRHIGTEAYLSASVGRGAMVRRRDGKVAAQTVVVGLIVVIEGRDGQQ